MQTFYPDRSGRPVFNKSSFSRGDTVKLTLSGSYLLLKINEEDPDALAALSKEGQEVVLDSLETALLPECTIFYEVQSHKRTIVEKGWVRVTGDLD